MTNILFKMIEEFWKSGSDKQSYHNYCVAYYKFLKNIEVSSILEIGVLRGESLRAWSKIYPNAEIHGIDIVSSLLFEEGNIKTFLVDQSSPESLNQFLIETDNKKYDFILDDGSHVFEHAKTSFEVLFDSLKNNGVYLIEDVVKVSNGWQQTIIDWHEFLETIPNIKYEIIDCHFGQKPIPVLDSALGDSCVIAIIKVRD
ncbi:MAG: class I SAM-dependent methyltransferase [Caulobacteraceae bacterium]|nr:class I SAM-dependent methyltransferase [Caulobacteraceae bacterium]